MKLISINLLAYNSKKYLPYCLPSLINQTYKNIEINIIDNNSEDGTEKYINDIIKKTNKPGINYFKNKKNLGFSVGHNQGINNAKGEYILIVNPDIVLAGDAIAQLVSTMEKEPRAAAIGPKLLQWKIEKNEFTDLLDSAGLLILKSHRVVERGNSEKSNLYNLKEEVWGITGACMLVKKSALESIKYQNQYFDNSFFAYKEDIDLCYRLRLAGYKIIFAPASIGWHARTTTAGKIKEGKKNTLAKRKQKSTLINFHSYKNNLSCLIKDEFLINLLLYFPWIFFYEIKKFFYLLIFERKTLAGLYYFIKNLPLTLRWRNAIFRQRKISARDVRKFIN